jgi:hypothetical protein
MRSDFMDSYSRTLELGEAWRAPNGLPHVMFMMEHALPPADERLFRTEVLTIIAIMITLLGSPSLQEHNVILVSHKLF